MGQYIGSEKVENGQKSQKPVQEIYSNNVDLNKKERIEAKMKVVEREIKAANLLFSRGKTQDARKLYVACAECLVRITQETQDDQVFTQAAKLQIENLIQKAKNCENS